MSGPRFLLPTGPGREALFALRRELGAPKLHPAFPREWLEGASAWEDGAELLHLAWELARCAPDAQPGEARALVLLAFVALAGERQGSTRVPVRGPQSAAALAAVLEPLDTKPEDWQALSELVSAPSVRVAPVLGSASEHKPLLLDGDWLSTQKLRAVEGQVGARLAARLAQADVVGAAEAKRARDAVLARPSGAVKLSDEQASAVEAALLRSLSVITGGPGTGKTAIVVAILRALGQLGVAPASIALAAPTGKAAQRLGEALRAQLSQIASPDSVDEALLAHPPEPRTLHRLLGHSPTHERTLHHERNPLVEEVVVVDEASMVDLFLMDRLLRALRPGARLLLLGDAEQLPSVDAGAVFRDLLPNGSGSADPRARGAVRLTRSYRMDPQNPEGRSVLSVAQALQGGALPEIVDGGPLRPGVLRRRAKASELELSGVELLEADSGSEAQRAFLDGWQSRQHDSELDALVRHAYVFGPDGVIAADRVNLERLFARAESSRLLCATRSERDLGGTGGVNAYFHARALAELQRQGELRGEPDFLPGEPVMVERNDYARGLWNGDSGLVLRGVDAREGRQRFMAVFRAGETFRAFHLDGLRGALSLAHAITVHKAQGSELDRVGLLLPARDVPVLTRELLYTALTRARRSVVIVGPLALLEQGARRTLGRFSRIGELLAGPGAASEKRG